MPPSLPLTGILVADFSRILAGPLCTQLLSDLGARVIKIEEPRSGDETRRWGPPFLEGESAYFLSVNRNKESLTLDLGREDGRAIARRIIERSDVVIHNFRDDQAGRFGLTADAVRAATPRAIHCAIRGFDRGSPEETLPGFDLLAQAAAGLMAITGAGEGGPAKVGVAISDVLTAHYAFGAITAALYERERSGVGRSLEISLVGATTASLVNVAQNWLVTGKEPGRYGNAHPSIVPYEAFSASDRLFVVAAASDRQYRNLCEQVLQRPDLANDPRFSTNADRVAHRTTLIPLLGSLFSQAAAAAWIDRCRAADVPAALVRGVGEAIESLPPAARETVSHPSAGELSLLRSPLRVDGEPLPIQSAPPLHGEQTADLLRELGYAPEEIASLHERSIT
jgi:crotonobetainyl-CoA:carnitine CoA-transferase CaiB-like acyl-CoA transferase